MKPIMKPTSTDSPDLITLTVPGVRRETADRLRVIADREYRSLAAELRRMIEERVADAPDLHEAA